jgi:hydrogenase maturation factor
VTKTELISNFLGGGLIGMIAMAMDYFFLQHFFMTPISVFGFHILAVLIYLFVPFFILMTNNKKTI